MWQLIIKYAVSALVIVAASEIAKRSGRLGALVASLPLVSVMVMIWMHVEGAEKSKVGEYAQLTFWYVLPTLPMFLVMPWMLGKGCPFWFTLSVNCFMTILLFLLTALICRRLGIDLF